MEWLIKLDADLLRQVAIQIATFLVFFVIVKVFFADKIKEVLALELPLKGSSIIGCKKAGSH